MRKVYFLLFAVLFAAFSNAQVTGTKTIGVDYPTLAAAVTNLNTVGVGAGGATINVPGGYTETAPVGGYLLGSTALNATLSAANTLTIKKNGTGVNPLLTAPVGTSTTVDGVFKLAGADYVTIDGINIQESSSNTTPTTAMECGYALVNLNSAAPFDGCNNNAIMNCSVTLNRTIATPSVGILMTHITPTNNTALVITAAADLNSNNKFYSNIITNCVTGMQILGYNAATPYTLYDQGNDVGGAAASTGNTVTNFVGTNYTSVGGITFVYQNAGNVSYNTVNQLADGGVNSIGAHWGIYAFGTNSTFTVNNNTISLGIASINTTYFTYGIYSNAAGTNLTANNNVITQAEATGSAVPMYGVFFANGNNLNAVGNTITQSQAASGATNGIYSTAVGTLVINSNTIQQTTTAAVTSIFASIYCSGTAVSQTTNSNIFNNSNINTTSGPTYLIYSNNATPNITATNNSVNGTFTKSGAGGTAYGYYNFSTPASGTATITDNNFSNISLTGATAFFGIYQATTTSQITLVNNNTISNITGGTSAMTGIYHSYGAVGSTANGNTISNLNGASTISGMQIGAFAANLGLTVANNNINTLNSTGASTVTGILHAAGANTTISKNKIYNLQSSNASGIANGITISAGTTITITNNLIGGLRAPITSSTTDAVRGINITSTTTSSAINVYHNTIYLNASSTGANFSASGIFHTTNATATTASLTLRNNIIYNNSYASGTGTVAAFRRSSGAANALTNYNAASNNNLFFAGTPSSSQLIYADGTGTAQTLAAYQAGVFTAGTIAPRDAASVTELSTPFLSTLGSDPNFLHLSTVIPTVAESGGANIAAVTDDYDGNARNATTPDIGADEFSGIAPAACGGTPVAGTISGTANICQGQSTILTLSGFSVGTGISVQWKSAAASGGPYSPISGATGVTYNTGVLATGTIYYVATVTCANGAGNSTTAEFSVTTNPTPTIAVSPAGPTICSGGTGILLTASGGNTYTWSPGTGLSATTGTSVTANPTVTTTYTVTGTTATGCSNVGTVTVTVNQSPWVPTVTPSSATICLNTIQQLSSPASATPTYAFGTQAAQNTAANTSTDYPAPYTIYWGGQRMQMLIRASELTAAGFVAGSQLSNIQFPVLSRGANWPATTTACQNFQLSIGATSLTTLSAFQSGLTQVVAPGNFTPTVGYTNTHTFSAPFTWDGTSNLIIETTFSNNIAGTAADLVVQYNSPTSYQSTIVYRADNVTAAAAAASTTVVYSYSARPDFKLNGSSYASPISWTPTTNLFTDAAATIPYAGGDVRTVYAKPTVTTTYTATATSVNGCTTPSSSTITVGTPIVTGSVTQPTSCFATDGAINLTITGGAGPYTYAWTGPGVNATSQNQSGLGVGVYTVTVTGSVTTCPAVVTYNLIGPGGCTACPTVGSVTTTPASTACSNTNVTFNAAGLASMGTIYGIQFKYSATALANPYTGGTNLATVANGALSGGGTGASATAQFPTAGTYFVYAIATPTPPDPACRPFAQTNITVNSAPVLTCPANITVNNTAGQCGAIVNYPAATVTGVPAPTVTYSTPSGSLFPKGVTTVTVNATNSCGTASCVFTVTVNDTQAPVVTCPANINVTTAAGQCTSTVTFTPTATDNCPGVTVTTSPASGSVFNLGATLVTVTAKDAANNISTCTFTVTVGSGQTPAITAQPVAASACAGSTATFSVTATNAVSYQWQVNTGTGYTNINGATSATLTLNNVTTAMNGYLYRVVVNGVCVNVTSNGVALSVNGGPRSIDISASPLTKLSPGQVTTLTAIYDGFPGNFTWYRNNAVARVTIAPTIGNITIDSVGTYKVMLTDINGCTATSRDLVISAEPNFRFFVFPNPTTDGRFQVRLYSYATGVKRTVSVYDSKGDMVVKQEFTVNSAYEKMEIDVSRYTKGYYHVVLKDASGNILGTSSIVYIQ